jgi:hypothetical protein
MGKPDAGSEGFMTVDRSSAFNEVSNERMKVTAAIRAIRTSTSFRIAFSKNLIGQR